jgi:16S rRNA (guanine527-N7)-methyltransferase
VPVRPAARTASATPPESASSVDAARLQAGCEALGLALTDAQIEQLRGFASLLLRWNRVHNLTAIEIGEDMLTHHLLDSLALVSPLRQRLAAWPEGERAVLDVGAGGGLPGIPLAIVCPDLRITLVDAVQKKTAFLTQVAVELKLANVRVQHARVETMRGRFPLITSRAFAALADFVRWTRHLLAPGGCWLAMKARLDADELKALPPDIEIAAIIPVSVPGLHEERHLLELKLR